MRRINSMTMSETNLRNLATYRHGCLEEVEGAKITDMAVLWIIRGTSQSKVVLMDCRVVVDH